MAPVIRPVTSSGLESAIAFSATLRPRRSTKTRSATAKTSGMRWLISTMAMPWSRKPADQVEHLRHLPHGDRGRRLVHQHDLGLRQPRAGDRHRLPLAARHAAHEVARARLGFQLGEQLAGALIHRLEVEEAEGTDALGAARARGKRWPPPSGCRKARGPDRRSRCPSRSLRPACGNAPARRPCTISPEDGGKFPAMIFTSVDLPAPLSPIRAKHLARLQRQVDVGQRGDRAEMLRNLAELKNSHSKASTRPRRFLLSGGLCAGFFGDDRGARAGLSRERRVPIPPPGYAARAGRARRGSASARCRPSARGR